MLGFYQTTIRLTLLSAGRVDPIVAFEAAVFLNGAVDAL